MNRATATGRRLACLAMGLPLLFGCEHTEGPYPTCGDDEYYRPIDGTLEVTYYGWAGTIPGRWIQMYVDNESAEAMHMTGCGYDQNGDWWWAELGFSVETTTARPVEFGPDGASANGFLERCPGGECVGRGSRRTWFGSPPFSVGLEGTLDTFDPIGGRFIGDVTMTDTTLNSLEMGSLSIEADFSWPSEYVPILEGEIGTDWHLYGTARTGESEFEQYVEILQSGYAIEGRLCDADFVCQDSDLAGKLADPVIKFSWTDPDDAVVEVYGVLDDTGQHFSGTALKRGSGGGLWDIHGDNVN